MLLLENAAALVNLHKLYNSLSLFIKSLSNILAYGWKRGRVSQTSVHPVFLAQAATILLICRKSVCLSTPLGGCPFLMMNGMTCTHLRFKKKKAK